MAIDERARHQLYLPAASTLMEHLPPTGWADVATKRDVDQSAALLRADIAVLRADLERSIEQTRAEFHKAIGEQTRNVVFANIGMFVAIAGVAFTAAHLT